MLLIKDYETYISYFKEMGNGPTHHVDLKDFYSGDSSEITQATLSKLSYPCLWLEDPDIKLSGVGRDNESGEFIGAFVIIENCPPDDFEKKRQLKQKCFNIALQIVARMAKDLRERNLNIDPESFSGDVINAIFVDGATGWRFEFRVKDPISICYDENKWTVPEP